MNSDRLAAPQERQRSQPRQTKTSHSEKGPQPMPKNRRRITLDDLPPPYRQQAMRQITRATPPAPAPAPAASAATPKPHPQPRQPNNTEAEYNRIRLHGNGIYEPLTLRLPGGSRYTPDFMTLGQPGGNGTPYEITLHEVKGSYRHPSHARARTAFLECAAAFPCFRFIWATRLGDGTWNITSAPKKDTQVPPSPSPSSRSPVVP